MHEQRRVTNLFLIRHGESYEETQHIIGDLSLTERGQQQVAALHDRLLGTQEIATIDMLIASPFERTAETASILASVWNDLPVLMGPGFQKWMPESAVGLHFDEFKRRYGSNPYHPRVGFPAEETWAQYLLRVYSAYNHLLEVYTGKSIVLVTHRGVMECSFSYITGATSLAFPTVHYDFAYTAITHWQHIADPFSSGWRLVKHNDFAHLGNAGGPHV